MMSFAQLRSMVTRGAFSGEVDSGSPKENATNRESTAHRFCTDERGATAIEYGLIVALISVAMMATVFAVGTEIKGALFGKIMAGLSGMF
jgi:pilus assembly protein Flp/PilA